MASELSRHLSEIERATIEAARREVHTSAEKARQMMVLRTTQGQGIDGRFFQGYAETTAKKKGRKAPVTLVEQGTMMESLQAVRIGPSVSDVRFRDKKMFERARYHNEGFTHFRSGKKVPARPWFGLSRSQQDELGREFGVAVIRNTQRIVDRRRRYKVTLLVRL